MARSPTDGVTARPLVLSLLAVGFLRSRPKKIKAAWLENLIWTLALGLLSRFLLEALTILGDASDLEAKGDPGPPTRNCHNIFYFAGASYRRQNQIPNLDN
jgi:hypothetical protein